MTNITDVPTFALVAERDRLVALRVWGPKLAGIDAELRRRETVRLAEDAYYAGNPADRSKSRDDA